MPHVFVCYCSNRHPVHRYKSNLSAMIARVKSVSRRFSSALCFFFLSFPTGVSKFFRIVQEEYIVLARTDKLLRSSHIFRDE